MTAARAAACVLALVVSSGLAGCSGATGDAGSTPAATTTQAGTPEAVQRDDSLAAELEAMGAEDQAERTGHPDLPPGTKLPPPKDRSRTARLQEIVAQHGWPTVDLVGEDGASAAWLVAQHADFDVEFQQQARDLMREAVAAGQADPVELAYLEDRVAVNLGRPQTYGSQVRCQGGVAAPATPLVDEAEVDDLRAAVGLGTLADYHAELAMMCANEEMDGQPAP